MALNFDENELLNLTAFEVNNQVLREKVADFFLDNLKKAKAAGNMRNYRVICDESNNGPLVLSEGSLIVDVMIQPTLNISYVTHRIIVGKDGVKRYPFNLIEDEDYRKF